MYEINRRYASLKDRSLHLQVRTSVAVRLGHSAVSTNTADMQRYWGDKIEMGLYHVESKI